MPTLLDIANELIEKFIRAKNKEYCAKHIIIEINSLHYYDSKEAIEYHVKVAIVNVIESNLIIYPKESLALSTLKPHILSKLDTIHEKRKVTINLNESFDLLKHNIEKYFLR